MMVPQVFTFLSCLLFQSITHTAVRMLKGLCVYYTPVQKKKFTLIKSGATIYTKQGFHFILAPPTKLSKSLLSVLVESSIKIIRTICFFLMSNGMTISRGNMSWDTMSLWIEALVDELTTNRSGFPLSGQLEDRNGADSGAQAFSLSAWEAEAYESL